MRTTRTDRTVTLTKDTVEEARVNASGAQHDVQDREGEERGASGPEWAVEVWRTFDASPQAVWELLVSDRGLAIWLGVDATIDLTDQRWSTEDADGALDRFAPGDEVCLRLLTEDRSHYTAATLAITAIEDGRTRLVLHEEELRDPGERTRRRHHWRGVADQLQAVLRDG